MKIKLSKALLLRKKLAKEITQIVHKIKSNNSILEQNKRKYDIDALYKEWITKVNELVTLKNAIAQKNKEIDDKIFFLSEYKAIVSHLSGINTTEGVVAGSRYGNSDKDTVYTVQWTSESIEAKVKEYEKLIEDIQDELNHFNVTTEIEI